MTVVGIVYETACVVVKVVGIVDETWCVVLEVVLVSVSDLDMIPCVVPSG